MRILLFYENYSDLGLSMHILLTLSSLCFQCSREANISHVAKQ